MIKLILTICSLSDPSQWCAHAEYPGYDNLTDCQIEGFLTVNQIGNRDDRRVYYTCDEGEVV